MKNLNVMVIINKPICGNNIDKQPWSIEIEKKLNGSPGNLIKVCQKRKAMKSYIISINDIINKYNLK